MSNSSPRVEQFEIEASGFRSLAEQRRSLWVVVLGLKPRLDGNQWCFLWGDNLQDGVAGFGASIEQAMSDFERAMSEKKQEAKS